MTVKSCNRPDVGAHRLGSVETIQLVPDTHYDVSITPGLAKNI